MLAAACFCSSSGCRQQGRPRLCWQQAAPRHTDIAKIEQACSTDVSRPACECPETAVTGLEALTCHSATATASVASRRTAKLRVSAAGIPALQNWPRLGRMWHLASAAPSLVIRFSQPRPPQRTPEPWSVGTAARTVRKRRRRRQKRRKGNHCDSPIPSLKAPSSQPPRATLSPKSRQLWRLCALHVSHNQNPPSGWDCPLPSSTGF